MPILTELALGPGLASRRWPTQDEAMNVTLEAITIDNFEAVMDMELPPEQARFLDSNAYSIAICYKTDNENGRRFYASLGFVETGLSDDGEMVAEIAP
ncbi:hypothetical protein LP419_40940 [Massilia sp. H-1]|nr:hypothetical protein LP419_40940 [Massilia sp. H-1]